MDEPHASGNRPAPPPLHPTAPPLATATRPMGKTRRPSYGWMIVALILTGLLGLSLLGNFQQLLSGVTLGSGGGSTARSRMEEVTVQNNGAYHKMAVVDLKGIITSAPWDRSGRSMVDYLKAQLLLAGEDQRVQAVILKVDSPGGEVMASDDLNRAITEFQDEYDKPVIASMGGVAASGGYYAAVACRWVVANELTITGSIGVILQSYNYRGLMDKVGVSPLVFKSGRFKDMLSGDKREEDILPEEKRMVQDLVDETFGRFKEAVKGGRDQAYAATLGEGQELAGDWEDYADGRILSGKQAYEIGFVDELGTFDTAYERALALTGVSTANLIRYQRPLDFGSLFRLFGEADTHTVKLDLGVDLPRLQAGRLYFLSPTLMQ